MELFTIYLATKTIMKPMPENIVDENICLDKVMNANDNLAHKYNIIKNKHIKKINQV